jgi:hypothetical protein
MPIPIISDIIDTIKWLIDFFVNKVPKPVLIVIFLLFIATIGLLMNALLQVGGIHCNNANKVVKTSILDFWGNVDILQASHSILNAESYDFIELFPAMDENDVIFYGGLNSTNGLYYQCGENDTGCTYLLKKGGCYNCTHKNVCIAENAWFCARRLDLCLGDAYYSPNLLPFACSWDYAKIPLHYYFNSSGGTYDCADIDYCGPGANKTATSQLDDLLKSKKATLYYAGEEDNDISRMVGLSCSDYQPQITFYKIPLLDYRIWVLLILIFSMFTFLTYLRQQQK